MATEAKMGMFIVVILVCAFCFLVYHKFDMKQRALLQANMQATGETGDLSAQVAAEQQSKSFDEFYPTGEPATAPAEFARASLREPPLDDFSAPKDPSSDSVSRFGAEPTSFAATAAENGLPQAVPGATAVVQTPSANTNAVAVKDPFSSFPAETSPSKFPAEPDLAFKSGPVLAAAETDQFKSVTPNPFGGESLSDPGFEAAATDAGESHQPLASTSESSNSSTETLFPVADEGRLLPSANERDDSLVPAFERAENRVAASDKETVTPADIFDSFNSADLKPVASLPARVVSKSATQPEEFPIDSDESFPFSNEPSREVADVGFGVGTASQQDKAFARDSFEEPAIAKLESVQKDEPQQLLAMLEPRQDVNLFNDDFAPPVKSPQSFPVADEPSMPVLGKSGSATPSSDSSNNDSGGLFTREPASNAAAGNAQEDIVPKPPVPNAAKPKVIQPPVQDSGFFREPVAQERPRSFDTSTPAVQNNYDKNPASSVRSKTTVHRVTVPENQWEPEAGAGRFVHGGSIQQVAGKDDECDICEVRLNDTYWTISKRAYGTAQYFSALALYNQNRISDPKKLRPGMKVLIPPPTLLEERYPELFKDLKPKERKPTGYFLQADGTAAYRIGENETLSEISQKHLGRASRWIQIYQMNRQSLNDPNRLKPGTVIALPDDATDLHVAP